MEVLMEMLKKSLADMEKRITELEARIYNLEAKDREDTATGDLF
jgi:BMFP domain-containing protein YqiC